jgi:hypothetical protein
MSTIANYYKYNPRTIRREHSHSGLVIAFIIIIAAAILFFLYNKAASSGNIQSVNQASETRIIIPANTPTPRPI